MSRADAGECGCDRLVVGSSGLEERGSGRDLVEVALSFGGEGCFDIGEGSVRGDALREVLALEGEAVFVLLGAVALANRTVSFGGVEDSVAERTLPGRPRQF